jgi:hypothetical protein
MKKACFIILISMLAFSAVFAQGKMEIKPVKIEGALQLRNGFVAVSSENQTYYVPLLMRYIGFLEGLKEGAMVSIDGFAAGRYLHPRRMVLDGKNYNFPRSAMLPPPLFMQMNPRYQRQFGWHRQAAPEQKKGENNNNQNEFGPNWYIPPYGHWHRWAPLPDTE